MKDILIKDDDALIVRGDFYVEESDAQQVELILKSKQGEWKEAPQVGIDISRAQNGAIDRSLYRDIRVQLEADGFSVKELDINEDGVNLNGAYETV
ncbi:hypothetical protein [Pedobacter cryoconitis]|uniref:Oxidase n=1 Tax=Pedobacter cryoconitis TaxID=188932 RepID=A0A7X0MHQ4_9SPHI|nr:hypothetical protein [Pedobacter cryoconitis]MBB6499111.1 hypothetical protein [Pedobacter cryoconitis]